MSDARPRAIIDTSVWISAFINPQGSPARILGHLASAAFVPVFSPAWLDEIDKVVHRPRIRRLIRFTDTDLARFRRLIEDSGVAAFPTGQLRLCRDPNDDFLLETAILGRARFIVSRDDDLKRDLDLIAHLRQRGVEIVTVAQFLQALTDPAS